MEDNKSKRYRKIRLLIADDEGMIRDTLASFLEYHGYEVIAARDGHEALTKLEDEKGEVDLLILDVTMPELNGFEVYEAVKKSFGPIPVIFSSGYVLQSTFNHTLEDVPKIFIQKPFSFDKLLRCIDELLPRDG